MGELGVSLPFGIAGGVPVRVHGIAGGVPVRVRGIAGGVPVRVPALDDSELGSEWRAESGVWIGKLFGVLRPELGVSFMLLRLEGREFGACGAGRFGRYCDIGLSGRIILVVMRSVRLPPWMCCEAAWIFFTVGGSINEAETGRALAEDESKLVRFRSGTKLPLLKGPVPTVKFTWFSSCSATSAEMCFKRVLDLNAAVLSFLIATSCISSADTGLCLIPTGVLNVV